MQKNVIDYKIAVSIFKGFYKQGLLTKAELDEAEILLCEKYGLSTDSIFRDTFCLYSQ